VDLSHISLYTGAAGTGLGPGCGDDTGLGPGCGDDTGFGLNQLYFNHITNIAIRAPTASGTAIEAIFSSFEKFFHDFNGINIFIINILIIFDLI
jgi:hypothetical protein